MTFSEFYTVLHSLTLRPPAVYSSPLLFTAAIKPSHGIAKRCSFADALDSCPELEAFANANGPIWQSDAKAGDARSNAFTQCLSKRVSIGEVSVVALVAEKESILPLRNSSDLSCDLQKDFHLRSHLVISFIVCILCFPSVFASAHQLSRRVIRRALHR